MSQYGNSSKNPPWARSGQNIGQSGSVPQTLMANPNMLQYPQVFQGQQMYGAVSYPTRALNTAAFQQGQQQGGGQQSGNKERVFTGTVTKIQDNFGFVDDDVFFQSSCCVKGSTPQVGDRVLVEALFNANMPFKWNATRIQVLNSGQDGGGQRPNQSYNRTQSNYNAVPPPKGNSGGPNSSRFGGGGSRFSGGGGMGGDRGNRGGGGGGGNMRRDEQDRKRRRDDRDKDDKAKSPPRKRSRSPAKAPRRPRRPPPRYNVTVPRVSLNGNDGDVVEIKKRYSNMYIPSDFFLCEYRWKETFLIGKPMSLDFPCSFHVVHKDVDPLVENTAVLEPPDADYIFSAKVMLVASPGLEDIFSKCIVVTEERENSKSTVDEDSLSHPSKLIHFLVGTRGKENMAIGGPWSASEDGENPASDPSVLVRTAIRTTKALTGIDLSSCTQWFRFVEVHYHRSETVYRGKSYPARVETVVIFVPDVWSCVPTRLEWDDLHLSYQKALDRKINDDHQKEEDEDNSSADKDSSEGQNIDKVKPEPKHFSELDPKNMKVTELREELEARSMSPKGLKPQLVARLNKAIKTEEEEDSKPKVTPEESPQKKEVTEKDKKEQEEKKKEEDEKKKVDERERKLLEKRYKLPQKPHIVVHPSKTAKSGKFDCSVQALSSLLGYRQDDTKEHSFEVSLFSELFNEMLTRDFGFNIYQAVVEAPEKPKEEKAKDDKEKSKDEKEKPKEDKEKSKEDKDKGKEDDKDKDQKKDKAKEAKPKDKDRENGKEVPETTKEVTKDDEADTATSEPEEQNEDEKESGTKEESGTKDENSKEKKGDKEARKDRAKLITYDKMLLLSFTFFDVTRCGYIYNKDLEDLIFSLGLALSRSQIRKLVGKLILGDAVYYRRLTDKPEGHPPIEHLPLNQIVGNKHLLPLYLSEGNTPTNNSDEPSEVKKGQMVMFNGTLVDVGKLMEQLTRSETTRVDTDRALGKLRDELSKLKEISSKSEKHIKELNVDLRDYRERLSSANIELSSLQGRERQYLRTMTDINEKIKPLINQAKEVKQAAAETEVKEVIDLVEEKGEEPMAVDEDK